MLVHYQVSATNIYQTYYQKQLSLNNYKIPIPLPSQSIVPTLEQNKLLAKANPEA